jgi:hypothetical protein
MIGVFFQCLIVLNTLTSMPINTPMIEKLKKMYENVSIVRHFENKGFGAAFWTGVLHAKGDYLVMVPGDGESNINDVIYMLVSKPKSLRKT